MTWVHSSHQLPPFGEEVLVHDQEASSFGPTKILAELKLQNDNLELVSDRVTLLVINGLGPFSFREESGPRIRDFWWARLEDPTQEPTRP